MSLHTHHWFCAPCNLPSIDHIPRRNTGYVYTHTVICMLMSASTYVHASSFPSYESELRQRRALQSATVGPSPSDVATQDVQEQEREGEQEWERERVARRQHHRTEAQHRVENTFSHCLIPYVVCVLTSPDTCAELLICPKSTVTCTYVPFVHMVLLSCNNQTCPSLSACHPSLPCLPSFLPPSLAYFLFLLPFVHSLLATPSSP